LDSEDEVDTKERLRSLDRVPESDFVSTRNKFSVPDAKGHTHHFEPQFIDDPKFDLFYVNSSSQDTHEIRINVGHPFLRRLQWGNPDVREAIIQMIYLMSVPEVFLPLRNSRSAFRAKINEIVDSTLTRLNRFTGDTYDSR
jgi:hypothetical protein